MVDFRPLLFINALALMLLVTAGFASVGDDHSLLELQPSPTPSETIETAVTNTPEPAEPEKIQQVPEPAPPKPTPKAISVAEPFSIPPLPEDTQTTAMTEQAAKPEPKPEPEPTTGLMVLRSNVIGDQVTINGKEYGATRLDLELQPGEYDVTISKPGYQSWQQTVALEAGDEMTLVAKLEAYTTVNYRNGTWVGGVRTGDGTYQDQQGLRYEGHFIDGKFHGKGTLTRANGDILTGQWAEGLLNGHGSLTTADGMLYVGGFRNNEFHGTGALTYPDGRAYEGEFSNGEFHGSGTEIFADGKKYEGQYMEGTFHGKGLLRNPNGSSIEATFRHGEPYGQVRLTTAAGEVFTARTTEPGVCYREKSYRATQCPQLEGW